MKFLRFNQGATGLLLEDLPEPRVLDIAASATALSAKAASELGRLLPDDGAGSWTQLIENWESTRPLLQELLRLAGEDAPGVVTLPLHAVVVRAPLPDASRNIFAIGSNFLTHAVKGWKNLGKEISEQSVMSERDQGLPPWGFVVLSDSIAGPYDDVGPPKDIQHFDYEAEVAIVLARGGRDIAAGDLTIWGFTAWNDLSIRDPRLGIGPAMNRGGFTWALEKNFDRGNVCGPYMVVDELDPNTLNCTLRVNGETRQSFNTTEMIWSFSDVVEHVSHYLSLKPGDMITSGTGGGVAVESPVGSPMWLKPGDLIEVEIQGAGIQRNRVI